MDNHAGNEFPFELGWIIGFIEGEGTIGIYPSALYKGKKQYKPSVRMYNTDERVIAKAIDCLTKLNLAHYVQEQKPRFPKRGLYVYRPLFTIIVSGYKRIKGFFEVVKPELFVGKKEQAETVYAFVCSRLSTEKKGWQFSGWKYTEKELQLFEKSKKLNLRGKGKRLLTDYTQSADNNFVKI